MFKIFIKASCLIVFSMILLACSAEKEGGFSKAFHNTTAKYNALFYGREYLKEVEAGMWSATQDNYDEILKVLPAMDSTLAQSNQSAVEEIIKMSSLVIEFHQNSDWVDDAYVLIGKARHYGMEYENATKTFKYVNSNSEDDNARHMALIGLLRTYTEDGKDRNANQVISYIKKEDLNKENLRDFQIAQADFYQRQGDLENTVINLAAATELMDKGELKSRAHFVIGQIMQELEYNQDSYTHYALCLKGNPSYELDFHSRLNIAQVSDFSDNEDIADIRSNFQKLLKDKKNEEYKDKIYYEMGRYEVKQNNVPEAITLFESSAAISTTNQRQKGLAYLALGRIYFDTMANYMTAQAYYDSCISLIPNTEKNFEVITLRNDILNRMAGQVNTIALQDSLLALSQLDSTTLFAMINEQILEMEDAEKKRARDERKRELAEAFKRNDSQASTSNQSSNKKGGGKSWYFYNINAVSNGQSDFLRVWGNRKLEDNWRRVNKASEITEDVAEIEAVDDNPLSSASVDDETLAKRQQMIDEFFAAIPSTKSQKDAANAEISTALFALGNIYRFELMESKMAAEAFETLLSRFPNTENQADAYYQLYTIYLESGDARSDKYRKLLVDNHPESHYSKIIQNPNYLQEELALNNRARLAYESAYQLYRTRQYSQAQASIGQAKSFDENEYEDNFKLLEILMIGQNKDYKSYVAGLESFPTQFPDSELLDYVKQLESAYKNFGKTSIQKELPTYQIEFDVPHSFVVIYDTGDATNQVRNQIEQFNQSEFPSLNLESSNLAFNDVQSMAVIKGFTDRSQAENYFRAATGDNSPYLKIQNVIFHNFIITESNLSVFYKSKDIASYSQFFNENYQF